ncbi:hypothetical protein [Shinella zoogloeoides]|uniref:hypothetical protein n=1 Tax=Shinella zoogloeoides TaxID=352475 RepID=UPI00273F6170|nr:hypothetical protein [Shinella zoogloeoides]WLR94233.1 hypothetical protein Q9316_08720 [Shinella zoogloeoides]
MNEELELALTYWRTMAPQPKALVYVAAIKAKLKGEETDAIVVDHELANAISRGASVARAKGIMADVIKADKPIERDEKGDDAPKGRRGRKVKSAAA